MYARAASTKLEASTHKSAKTHAGNSRWGYAMVWRPSVPWLWKTPGTEKLAVCRAWLMSCSSICQEVMQGKPVLASVAGNCSRLKPSMAYIRRQWQCCGLSEDQHRLVVTHDLDLWQQNKWVPRYIYMSNLVIDFLDIVRKKTDKWWKLYSHDCRRRGYT